MPLSISIIKIESLNFAQQPSEIPLVYKNTIYFPHNFLKLMIEVLMIFNGHAP